MSGDNDQGLTEGVSIALAVAISGFFGFVVAYWVWPWLGPQVLDPCPQWTTLGIGLYTAHSALKGIGHHFRQEKHKQVSRRLRLLEENTLRLLRRSP